MNVVDLLAIAPFLLETSMMMLGLSMENLEVHMMDEQYRVKQIDELAE